MSPFILGFQNHMTSWMSSLISQQDRCMRMVAQQANLGRLCQEQLEQTVAMEIPSEQRSCALSS